VVKGLSGAADAGGREIAALLASFNDGRRRELHE